MLKKFSSAAITDDGAILEVWGFIIWCYFGVRGDGIGKGINHT